MSILRFYPVHKKLFEEIEKIKKTAFQKLEQNPLRDFEKIWSETFFGFDYHFSIQEIFEIVLWCFNQADFFREMNEFQKEIIPKDCLKYLDRMYIGLGLENRKPSEYIALDFSYSI